MEDLASNDSLIDRLPDNCLRHIFSFLPILERLKVEKVCKRWRILSEGGWHDIKELKIDPMYSENIIHSILKRCGRFLKKLSIFDSPEQLKGLSMVIQLCQLDQFEDIEILMLNTFGAGKFELNSRNLREICERTKKLVAVTISGDLTSYGIDYLNFLNPETLRKLHLQNFDDDRLAINPDRFPTLKELHLENMEIIGDEMKSENQSLRALEKINLKDCLIPQNFIQRIGTFTNLQDLTFSDNVCDIKNEHIRNIARDCNKMEGMTLSYSPSMTSDCFKNLGTMPSLEILQFEDFENVNSGDIAYLTNVRKLFFHDCTDILSGDGLFQLIVNSPNLEELELYYIRAMNMTFLNDVQQIFHRGQREKRLILKVALRCDTQLIGISRKIINHPLLDLRVINNYSHEEESDEDD